MCDDYANYTRQQLLRRARGGRQGRYDAVVDVVRRHCAFPLHCWGAYVRLARRRSAAGLANLTDVGMTEYKEINKLIRRLTSK